MSSLTFVLWSVTQAYMSSLTFALCFVTHSYIILVFHFVSKFSSCCHAVTIHHNFYL